jgi:hypothetical protein
MSEQKFVMNMKLNIPIGLLWIHPLEAPAFPAASGRLCSVWLVHFLYLQPTVFCQPAPSHEL